jgi:chemotaxis signal transduction protein
VTAPALLVARAGGERYGFDIVAVREVVAVGEATPVPARSAALRGVVPYQGRHLSLFSLEALLTGRAPPPRGEGAAVVVMLGEADVALEVDEVEAVVGAGSAYVAASTADAGAARGVCRCGDALVTVLDTALLAARVAAHGEVP